MGLATRAPGWAGCKDVYRTQLDQRAPAAWDSQEPQTEERPRTQRAGRATVVVSPRPSPVQEPHLLGPGGRRTVVVGREDKSQRLEAAAPLLSAATVSLKRPKNVMTGTRSTLTLVPRPARQRDAVMGLFGKGMRRATIETRPRPTDATPRAQRSRTGSAWVSHHRYVLRNPGRSVRASGCRWSNAGERIAAIVLSSPAAYLVRGSLMRSSPPSVPSG